MPGRYFLNQTILENVQTRSRGYMPHWEIRDGTYSITFRERDSLPAHVIARLRQDRKAIERSISAGREPTAVERAEIRRLFDVRIDAELDCGHGSCRLTNCARLVADALCFFDGQRYELISYCVMPNHVHVVATLRESLAKTVHSWKSFVAHAAGEKLWAREYFDRLIRDDRDLEATVAYVRDNPRKAGLGNWPWVR